jgi:uncharacterized membrane protein YeaQ/YmgE (transglycosylase-associated protein family)
MDLIISLLVGALIGWLASMIMKTDAQQGAIANVIVGILGAALGRFVFADLLRLGGASAGGFSIGGVLWGVLGACLLIALWQGVRRLGTRAR